MDSTATANNPNYQPSYFQSTGGLIRGGMQYQQNSSSLAPQSSAFSAFWTGLQGYLPSRETVTLCGVIAAGLTLIGTTTYFVATRLIRKRQHSSKDAKLVQDGDASDVEFDGMSDDDDLDYRMSIERKRRARRRNMAGGSTTDSPRTPMTLITFAELFEQAFFLHQQRLAQRNVKIYFDSNDEFVR